MSFEKRLLYAENVGATNRELGVAWFNELQKHIESSPEQYSTPWVLLNDCRQWDLASEDAWEVYNSVVAWMAEHNCVLLAFLVTNRIQNFAIKNGFHEHGIEKVFFDYDEAYQACLDALAQNRRSP
ncbi:hypothetical protein [Vibrio sinus]